MNREDLEGLVRVHQAGVYRYLRYLGADAAAAEDLAQETFIAAYGSRMPAGVADDPSIAAWLRGIARNLFLRHCRRSRISPVRADSSLLDRAEAVWAGQFLRGGDGFDYVEALRACLRALPDKHRRIIEMRYAEGQSRESMARLCEMSGNGVKSLLRRIRATLGECIRRRLRLEAT